MKDVTRHALNVRNHTGNHGVKPNDLNIFTKPRCNKLKVDMFNIVQLFPIYIYSIPIKGNLIDNAEIVMKGILSQ